MIRYALFETAIGWAGVAWNDRGLTATHLPEPTPETARKSFLRRCLGATEAEAPPEVRRVIGAICDLMAGKSADFTGVRLDLSRTPEFHAPGET